MIKMPNKDKIDYSGVCLLVTKALEIETTKRFFTEYKNYLSKEVGTIQSWPKVLKKKERGHYVDKELPESEFTLGSVVPVVGYKRLYDNNVISSYTSAVIKHYPASIGINIVKGILCSSYAKN